MDEQTLIDLLLGRNSYGMSPEMGTDWMRLAVLLGFGFGCAFILVVQEVFKMLSRIGL